MDWMRLRRAAVGLFAGIALSLSLEAQGTAGRGLEVAAKSLGEGVAIGRQWLVLIGIDRYRNDAWPALRNPVKDCRELRDILTERYVVDEVVELYDAAASATGIYELFGRLQKSVGVHDSLLIYYAGHGNLSPVTDVGYIIASDGGPNPGSGWISNGELRGMIRKIESRHVCLIMDSCFSGDILDDRRSIRPTIDDQYFRAAYAKQSRQVLTSGASETVPDQSEFALQLKAALKGSTRAYVDPLILYSEIRAGMRQTQPLFGSLKEAGHQEGGSFLLFMKPKGPDNAKAAADGSSGREASAPASGGGMAAGPGPIPGPATGASSAAAGPAAPKPGRIAVEDVGTLRLPEGESVDRILSSGDSGGLAFVSVREEGIIQKKYSFFVHQLQSGMVRGPFRYFSANGQDLWRAEDAAGNWYIGSALHFAGPLSGIDEIREPDRIDDRNIMFQADIPRKDGNAAGGYPVLSYVGMASQKDGGAELSVSPTAYSSYWYFRRSSDGLRYSFIGRKEGKDYLVSEKGAEGPYDEIYYGSYSEDGEQYAYPAKKGASYYLLGRFGVKGPFEDMPRSICFSPTQEFVAYYAKGKEGTWLYAGDEKAGPFKKIGALAFSPDGRDLVFSADGYVFRGRQRFGPFSENPDSFVFSKDGKRFAFRQYTQNSHYIETSWGERFGPVSCPSFGFLESGSIEPAFWYDGYFPTSEKGREVYRFVKGKEEKSLAKGYVMDRVTSSNDKHLALVADIPGGYYLVTPSYEIEIDIDYPHGLLDDGSPVGCFSRDEQRYLFVGSESLGPFQAVWGLDTSKGFRFLAMESDGRIKRIEVGR